jgi:hypothetical protein
MTTILHLYRFYRRQGANWRKAATKAFHVYRNGF